MLGSSPWPKLTSELFLGIIWESTLWPKASWGPFQKFNQINNQGQWDALALLHLLEQTQLTQPAADPLTAPRQHRWPWTALLFKQGCREHAQAYAALHQGPEETRLMQSEPGLVLVTKLLLSSITASLRCGAVQENKPPFTCSQVQGGMEDAFVTSWDAGGGTGVGGGPFPQQPGGSILRSQRQSLPRSSVGSCWDLCVQEQKQWAGLHGGGSGDALCTVI